MKKWITLALALVLALSLAACSGGDSNSGSNSGGNNPPSNTPNGDSNSTTPPASQGGDTAPSGNNNDGNSGGFVNIMGDPLTVPETAATIEEAIGVSVEGTRIVRKYTDRLFDLVNKPDGCAVIYSVYEFDADGKVSDSSLWYGGFTDDALFSAAFQKALDQTFEKHIRGYNVSGGYYAHYTFPAISTNAEDGVATWDDAVAEGEYESDDNHILIV